MGEPRVSLITPCYNGSKHLEYFFNSLGQQSYKNVEFIFINDGSTDNTEELFNHYKSLLEKKGWSVKYIFQKNKGQAAALNSGLKIFTGQYLMFPDSDDILYPDHIKEKVYFMESNKEFGFAFCKIDLVKEDDLDNIVNTLCMNESRSKSLFIDLIERNNILWMPICNIFRTSAFLEAVPSREIYSGQGGQNFQMLLPMAHKYKCGYIDKTLGKYVLRKASHSHSVTDPTIRIKQLMNIWINTIYRLDDSNENKSIFIQKAIDHFLSSLQNKTVPLKKQKILKCFLFNLIEIFKIKYINNDIIVYVFGCKIFRIRRT